MAGIYDKILDKLNLLGPASQANPLRGNVFSDAADSWISSGTANAYPEPVSHPVGADYAQALAAQHGDPNTLAAAQGLKLKGLEGVKRAAPVRNPDVFIGGRPQVAPQQDEIVLPTSPVRRSLV